MEHLDTAAERLRFVLVSAPLKVLLWYERIEHRLVFVCMLQINKACFQMQRRNGPSVLMKSTQSLPQV